ncbi:NAD(+) diphosphatase [Cereibacter sp. SYSU M97828]|nr:NAD(+) diphosphatase [Cereibacter flavus]
MTEILALGGSGLDRAATLREKSGDLLGQGGVLPVWRGKVLMQGGGLLRLDAASPVLAKGGVAVFLGMDDGTAIFAQDISDWSPEAGAEGIEAGFVDASRQTHPALDADAGFVELRQVMADLTPRDAELAAMGKALVQWHRSHRFCATCGAESAPAMGGWQRDCPACGAKHFPRTDPVVIMLVLDGNRLLLGRSHGWPDRMYSCLAGFVEPGETIEDAVRREVMEETGIAVGRVDYLASQPWPFPASLMLGCRAEARSREIRIDPVEIEDARWATREEMFAAIAGVHPDIAAPRVGSIARFLISSWLADRVD